MPKFETEKKISVCSFFGRKEGADLLCPKCPGLETVSKENKKEVVVRHDLGTPCRREKGRKISRNQ